MLLTRSTQYAIAGILRMANQSPTGFCRVKDLVRGTTAPPHAVAKVFQTLARYRVLESVRGTGGGFRLSKGALDLTLMQVLEVVDGEYRSETIMDRGLCLPGCPCALEQVLGPVASELERVLGATRLRDLLAVQPPTAGGCCPTSAAATDQPQPVKGDRS